MADEDQVCPNCGSSSTAKIMYGRVTFNDELRKDLEAKRVKLGGCIITTYSREWYCNDCSENFGRKIMTDVDEEVELGEGRA